MGNMFLFLGLFCGNMFLFLGLFCGEHVIHLGDLLFCVNRARLRMNRSLLRMNRSLLCGTYCSRDSSSLSISLS